MGVFVFKYPVITPLTSGWLQGVARGVSRQESQVADTSTGIRWAEVKTSGVSCRSARMKLPARWGKYF